MVSSINYLILQFNLVFKKILRIHDYDKKAPNSVNVKVSNLCAGILNDKSAVSPTTVVFDK